MKAWKFSLQFLEHCLEKAQLQEENATPGAPLTYFNDWGKNGGGGGPSDFFGSEILAKSDFLGSMKEAGIFIGPEKTEGIFWVAKKGLRGFFGYAKKKQWFFWVDKFWNFVIFLGIKYELLSDSHVIKICDWGP